MASCATPALWDATDPDQWARASKTNVSTNDLVAKGIEYRVDESTGDIFIPKSQLHKLGDYTIRVLATPFAVTLDAVGGATIICGAILIGGLSSEWESHVRDNPDNPEPISIYPEIQTEWPSP